MTESYDNIPGGFFWHEILVDGKPTGIEVAVYGPESDMAAMAEEHFRKRICFIPHDLTEAERFDAVRRAENARIAELISEIRGKDGSQIVINGRQVLKKDIPFIAAESPAIINSVARFLASKKADTDDKQLEKAVKQYFFLNQQYSKKETSPKSKTGEKKSRTVLKKNIDEREKFIKIFSREEFDKLCAEDPKWAKYRDEPFPPGTSWLFGHFLEMWYSCRSDFNGNKIFTPRTILDYCECFGVELTIFERRKIMSMKHWAVSVIQELNKQSD